MSAAAAYGPADMDSHLARRMEELVIAGENAARISPPRTATPRAEGEASSDGLTSDTDRDSEDTEGAAEEEADVLTGEEEIEQAEEDSDAGVPVRKRESGRHPTKDAIYKVLKQVHPDTGISADAQQLLQDLLVDVLGRLVEGVLPLVRVGADPADQHPDQRAVGDDPSVVTSREIQTSIRLNLPRELGKFACSEMAKAVTKFNSFQQGAPKTKKGRAVDKRINSGLQFSPDGMRREMMRIGCPFTIDVTGCIAMAATLEYLCAEVLELAGNACKDFRKKRIIPRHILFAIRGDEELDTLYHGVLAGGGVIPHIHKSLVANQNKLGARKKLSTIALREIRREQLQPRLISRERPFRRAVRDAAAGLQIEGAPVTFTARAYDALQAAAEAYLVEAFENSLLLSIHRGGFGTREDKLRAGDMRFAVGIMCGIDESGYFTNHKIPC